MADIHQHVLSNLVLPWTQVLCYFVDVSADLHKIRQLLEVPRRKARIGSQPAPDFLHVIVVLIGNEENPDYDAAFEALILYSELEPQLDITFLDLRNRHELSSTAAFEPLRRAVLDHISVIQKNQIDQGFAYSAQHLCRFWRRTLELEMRRLEDSAIDCLAIARESHELNSVKKDHLVSFLQEASESGWDKDEVYAFIASALLMNAYPPSMHRAINLMDLVFNKASAEHSFQRFPQFAQEIFGSTSAVRELSIFKCVSWVKCLIGFLADGQYDGKNLEEILKRALGSKRRIFDVGTTPCADCRVAIITSRISDGKACVLANYRGVGVRSTQSAYQFLMPQAHDQNPLLWEAARCSVAAPWFFKTMTLPGFGPLQDGGVRANNPLAIALKESEIIWPKAGKHDLLVSVGTGSKVSGDSISETTRGNVLRDSAVPRLIRATMASPSMDGEQGFFEALNYIPDHMRAGIHRLDHAVSQSLPRLDDVNKVMELAGSTFKVPDNLVHTILVTGFLFFEIDQTPLLKQGAFFCRGSILCKGSNPRSVVNGVRREFPGARFQTTRGYHLGLLDEDDGCCECGYFRKKVAFTVNSLDEMFTIEVATFSTKQKVGGFPTSVQELLSNQQAYNCFGNTDHSIAAWPRRRTCFCLRGTRRFNQLLEPPVGRKKRRLDL
ncbi:hypothetical protein N7490_006301 [Penicillium lividum]|nr:hypothetical protein N7490_006301 [Penicillium lividum]